MIVLLGKRGRGRAALARRALNGSRNGKRKEMCKTAAVSLLSFFLNGEMAGELQVGALGVSSLFPGLYNFWGLRIFLAAGP